MICKSVQSLLAFFAMLIICTGASGLIGYNFIESATKRGHKVIGISQNQALPSVSGLERMSLDLTNHEQIERLILDKFPDAIVNCAAISSPAVVEKEPELAKKMNIDLPEKLAQLANHVGARLIHLSTDMVFDGKCAPYINTDVPTPFNLYGETKLEAEKKVLAYAAACSVVLRISHVCGRGLSQKRSLDEKLFLAWSKGEKTAIPSNEIKRFLAVDTLAELLVELVERQNLTGIYHYAGSESLSRYEAAKRICKRFKLDPAKFIEDAPYPALADFSLDCQNLLSKVKTRALSFEEVLDRISIPDACLDWYEKETGIRQIKRYKL